MAGEPQDESRFARERALYDRLRGGISPNPFPRPSVLPNLRQRPGLDPVATIGGQAYRQVDNGRANMLVPAGPLASPAQLAQQRAAIERALYMANNPLAGGAYGIATLAGASPQVRDAVTLAAGTVDTAMLGAAPFGARTRSPLRPPPTPLPRATLARDPIRTQPANSSDQATGATATVTESMLNTGKSAQGMTLPGLLDKWHRGHLIAKGLGGTAASPSEAMALDPRVNQGAMRTYEKSVMDRVRAGEVVEYFVKPLYSAPASAPSAVVLSAEGSRGGFTPRIIPNPAPRRK